MPRRPEEGLRREAAAEKSKGSTNKKWSKDFEGTQLCIKTRADRQPLVAMFKAAAQVCMVKVGLFSNEGDRSR